ncbi:MAG: hypothetical protein ABIV50_05330, partial [Opitutus sp.]
DTRPPDICRSKVGGSEDYHSPTFVIVSAAKNPGCAHRRIPLPNNWILRVAQDDRYFENSLAHATHGSVLVPVSA